MTTTVLFNGSFVPEENARVGVDDGGWLHGAGLFETMRAEYRSVFRLENHLDRLRRSAAVLLHEVDRSVLPSAAEFRELLERNDLNAARVRLTVTAGSMRGGADEDPALTVCATAVPLGPPAAALYEDGVQVRLNRFRTSPTDPLAGHKTTCYLPRLLGLREARQARCSESLWFTTLNHLAEGSISNVFLVKADTLRTPPLDTPVLPGIAREVVLSLGRELGLNVEEVASSIDDLLDADEVLLTNTIMLVLPAVRIERHDVGGGVVGPVARRLLESFHQLIRRECAPS